MKGKKKRRKEGRLQNVARSGVSIRRVQESVFKREDG